MSEIKIVQSEYYEIDDQQNKTKKRHQIRCEPSWEKLNFFEKNKFFILLLILVIQFFIKTNLFSLKKHKNESSQIDVLQINHQTKTIRRKRFSKYLLHNRNLLQR